MFKKAPTLGNSTALKNSDRRNLQKELSERYNVTIDECKTIFPETVKQCKATTSAGDHLTLFTAKEPVAFRLGKGEQGPLIPTVYTIWNSSISLPLLITNDMVLEKLQDGADLFAPGIWPKSLATFPEDLPEGSIVGVGTLSVNNAVRAIGRLCYSSSTLKAHAQGKAVEILHIEGDSLWSLGSKAIAQPRSTLPAVVTEPPSEASHTDDASASVDVVEGPDNTTVINAEAGPTTSVAAEGPVPLDLSAKDVDALLTEAVAYSISQILSKQANPFPLSSSKFIDTYVLPSRRASIVGSGQEVSIKKSSHKNASAFLKQLKKDGLIMTKDGKGGEVSVIGVEKNHAAVKAFKPYKTVGDAQKQEKKREVREVQEQSKASQRLVEVTELHRPHGSTVALCQKLGFGKDALILPLEIRNAIQDYVAAESLIIESEPSYITLDDLLSGALLKKGEQLDFMPRSEVMTRLLDGMQAWHRLVINDGGQKEEIQGKGAPKKVSISVKKRQGKKLVTIIEGLETFQIPHQKLAEDLQLKCASSATFGEVNGSSPKKPVYEVVVQGSQTAVVVKELADTWGVPKNWISIAK